MQRDEGLQNGKATGLRTVGGLGGGRGAWASGNRNMVMRVLLESLERVRREKNFSVGPQKQTRPSWLLHSWVVVVAIKVAGGGDGSEGVDDDDDDLMMMMMME
ncbi:hypothetical protein Tco_0970112 [Tanacetum coccineum]